MKTPKSRRKEKMIHHETFTAASALSMMDRDVEASTFAKCASSSNLTEMSVCVCVLQSIEWLLSLSLSLFRICFVRSRLSHSQLTTWLTEFLFAFILFLLLREFWSIRTTVWQLLSRVEEAKDAFISPSSSSSFSILHSHCIHSWREDVWRDTRQRSLPFFSKKSPSQIKKTWGRSERIFLSLCAQWERRHAIQAHVIRKRRRKKK